MFMQSSKQGVEGCYRQGTESMMQAGISGPPQTHNHEAYTPACFDMLREALT